MLPRPRGSLSEPFALRAEKGAIRPYSRWLSVPPRPRLSSLCEGMLTRCSAPTFMEMHPLIYPGSACSRLCLTSVLREVYYLPSETSSPISPLPAVRSILASPLSCLRHLPSPFRPYPSICPLSIPRGSTFDASHSRIIRIRFPMRPARREG